MPNRVQFTWKAREDLLDLFALVAEETGSERAELVLHRIHTVIAALADWPGIGRRRSDLDGTPRTFAVPPWLIVYEAQPGERGIFVWRVVDGRRDLTAVIHPPQP
jgi:plasmid stabilization system protein ParE